MVLARGSSHEDLMTAHERINCVSHVYPKKISTAIGCLMYVTLINMELVF